MSRLELPSLFVLNTVAEASTKQDFKAIIEKLGIKVALPMSHGDLVTLEYTEAISAKPKVAEPIKKVKAKAPKSK